MLLSQVMRRAAITGRTDVVPTQLLGRQGGRWAQQWIDSAYPDAAARSRGRPPQPSAADGLRVLDDLHRRGRLTDDEFDRVRARLRDPDGQQS